MMDTRPRYIEAKRARKSDKITKFKNKLIKKHKLNEHRSAGGSWEEPVSAVRNAPLRRSQRLNSTLDSRSTGQLRNTLSRARELCERWRSGGITPPAPPPDDEGGGRLARWFSVRRGSTHQYDMHSHETDKMPKLPELEEDLFSCGGEVRGGRVPPPSLGPPPDSLTPVQLRRRHVVAAIIHSENSYVATLQRLVNDYKKPLEESSPAILNASKIQTLFHRLPDILQCHLHFRTALADCAQTWDRDEKIGEVFLSAFSKAVVLDVYSDFINNFSVAMELAKMESKRKSALADFFKVKQISAHDRLSFFGLMVKPVQRFPQFIMFLQDLLKHTPPGHADRVALQRALTRLEALAEALNERKRDAERTQAFRAALRRLTRGGVAGAGGAGGATRFGAARLLASRADKRHLLRQDDLLQMEFNQSGGLSKCKPRRLLLLNDLVVCVSVGAGGDDAERLGLKWAHPVQDVEVLDTGTSPTLSRVLAQGMNRSGSLRSNSSNGQMSTSTGDSLCGEMSTLMHDYETVSRMADLAASLKTPYPELAPEMFKTLLQSIQQSIQKKDDEMAWVDSCCLQLRIRGREEALTFRANEPGARLGWATALRLAQLAQAPANSPAWRVPVSHAPPHKMPLFVDANNVYSSKNLTEVRCGCFYTSSGNNRGASLRRARSLLWVCAGGAALSHVAVLTHRAAKLKTLVTLDLPDTKVTSMEFAKGIRQVTTLCGDTVWLGTEDKKIIIFSAVEPEKQEKLAEVPTVAAVTQIRYHCDAMFVGLTNGRVAVYRRNHDDSWALQEPLAIELGDKPVHCLLPVDGILYATCARRVFAINALTAEIMRILELKSDGDRTVKYLAHSGVGLWTAFSDSTFVSLYHAETFEHLQNIDIAADVAKTIGARDGSKPAYVSALLASQGLLWVGTTAGVSVTVPLPKLEGLPLVGGHIAVSYHAHAGPVTFLLSLLPETRDIDVNAVRRNLSNARALADVNIVHEFKEEDSKEDCDKPKLERRISEETSPYRPQRVHSAVVRRKKPGDVRLSKTLPKCANLNACDVYGLFGDLIFVKDCVGENDVSGGGGEAIRRSDPELATIPFRVSTLDRRLRMRAGRPRSLDLSNWSVDSRASSLCTSSGSEESMALRGVSRNSSGASGAASLAPVAVSTPESSVASSKSSSQRSVGSTGSAGGTRGGGRSLRGADYAVGESAARRSVLTVMGGRGYVDWRQTAEAAERPAPAADPNPKDAYLVLWEMRL
ncbi:rho guanine nucleotide exchange factor 10-like isoform X2 [Bombyx mandarina]|uniref:Rho guanine nucleotide exchange factor 10-like isoform X1 n=1 Tax=Bombyx mandarina TaxID=7092 RepID=A0A6J2KRJ5_BOMMA|nr:rho guanine nucleotide exchange factor 10-like isoform X1 [Bombyx mandarina]XP_028042769.1 rho guanine nucleotide exchange factor 10-like isoform X2 [Bombyx mandarina]